MNRRAVLGGAVAGLVIGELLAALRGPLIPSYVPRPPLQEDRGRITRVVMQYHPTMGPVVAPLYSQFLSAVGKDVQVVWVVAQKSDLEDLRSRLGSAWPEGRCQSVIAGKEITTWSKDRFVALASPGSQEPAVLCAPARDRTANPLRTHDQEVPYRLAQSLPARFDIRGTQVVFDGGDILAAGGRVFAHPSILTKNPTGPGSPFPTTAALQDNLAHALNTPLTWLGSPDDAPPHHVCMYLTIIGQTAVVGDVNLAEKLAGKSGALQAALSAAGGEASPADRAEMQRRLDKTAAQMASLGYRVIRVPLTISITPHAWMSYNNGILETRDGETIFYMPSFGIAALDRAAVDVFHSQAHCRVVPINCSTIWPLCGSLHCLVNVVARSPG